ncbi:transmembrane protein 179B-like [Anneissia japonica]|uniref:transmembrane protein 179B-like n=1 Tax=Anneissia japonica TaxID=1529436 RepID=UPI00142584BF|nr:transmembrane protein 179B-like [Anneissia japonica]
MELHILTIVLILEIILLYASSLTGLSIAVFVGKTKNDFQGQCILGADVKWNTSSNFVIYTDASNASKCAYCIGLHIVLLLFSLVYATYWLVTLMFKKEGVRIFQILSIVLYGIFTFLVFVQAGVLTRGLNRFCNGLTSGDMESHIESCQESQDIVRWRGLEGASFYNRLKKAETASWLAAVFWLIMLVLAAFRWIYEKRQSSVPKNTIT